MRGLPLLRPTVGFMSNQPVPGAAPTTESFGARLALIRWQQGWNIKEAALACNVPPGSWREWELSSRQPRNEVEVCKQIGARTGVPWLWILTNEQPTNGGPSGGSVAEPPSPQEMRTRRDSNSQPSDLSSHSNLRQLVAAA